MDSWENSSETVLNFGEYRATMSTMQSDVHIVNDRKGTQSLSRGLAILSAFSYDRRELSVRELAAQLGISRPTAYRLAKTLEQHGFLQLDPSNKTYGVGLTAFAVGQLFLPSSFSDVVDQLLEELRGATTHTVHAAVLDGSSLVMIAAKESRNLSRIVAHIGQRFTWHATAAGKAFLASLSNAEVVQLIHESGLPRMASRTITDLNDLLADLELVRARGYATATDEFAEGLHSIGMLVQGPKSVAPYTLAISMPSGLSQTPEESERLVTHLRRAAGQFATIIAQYSPFVGSRRY